MTKKCSMEQFQEIAELLNEFEGKFWDLHQATCPKLPKSITRHLCSISDHLGKFRSKTEDKMFEEHPKEASVNIFYGDNQGDDKYDLL